VRQFAAIDDATLAGLSFGPTSVETLRRVLAMTRIHHCPDDAIVALTARCRLRTRNQAGQARQQRAILEYGVELLDHGVDLVVKASRCRRTVFVVGQAIWTGDQQRLVVVAGLQLHTGLDELWGYRLPLGGQLRDYVIGLKMPLRQAQQQRVAQF
jgi:hypothetical protein